MAIDRLLNQNAKVADLADYLGFTEPSSFVRSFKSWTGQTPRKATGSRIQSLGQAAGSTAKCAALLRSRRSNLCQEFASSLQPDTGPNMVGELALHATGRSRGNTACRLLDVVGDVMRGGPKPLTLAGRKSRKVGHDGHFSPAGRCGRNRTSSTRLAPVFPRWGRPGRGVLLYCRVSDHG